MTTDDLTILVDRVERTLDHDGAVHLGDADGIVEILDRRTERLLAVILPVDPSELQHEPFAGSEELDDGSVLEYDLTAATTDTALLRIRTSDAAAGESRQMVAREPRGLAPAIVVAAPERPRRPRVFWAQAAAAVVLVIGLLGAGLSLRQQLDAFDRLGQKLGLDKPFNAAFVVVGRRSLQLDLTLNPRIVREVRVDWGDPTKPDPVGGTIVYPTNDAEEFGDHVLVPGLQHEYPTVGPEGLSTTARIFIQPGELPKIVPVQLAPERLAQAKKLLVSPYGIVLDPSPERLRVAAPPTDAVVSAQTELTVEMGALRAPVHVFVSEQNEPRTLRYLRSIAPPAPGEESVTKRIVVDTSGIGLTGPFVLTLVSTSDLTAEPGAMISWQDLPYSAPRGDIELRHAGMILEPAPGASVDGSGIVRARVLVSGMYAVVAIRPIHEGRFYAQNEPLAAQQFEDVHVAVQYGGHDQYEVWVALTAEPSLFARDRPFTQRPDVDDAGRPVHWLGPVLVQQD